MERKIQITCHVARMVAEDGESNWLEGLMLLMIYVILAMAFFVLPEPPSSRMKPSESHQSHETGGQAKPWRPG